MKFGIHTGLWLARWTDDIEPAIRHAAELGYDGVEISLLGMSDDRAAALGQVIADHGLEVTCSDGLSPAHDITSADEEVWAAGVAYLRWAVETTAKLGSRGLAGVLFAPWGQFDPSHKPERLARSARALAAVSDTLENEGVTLGLEALNRFETDLLNTAEEACTLAGPPGQIGSASCSIPSISISKKKIWRGRLRLLPTSWCTSTFPIMTGVCRGRATCHGIRSSKGCLLQATTVGSRLKCSLSRATLPAPTLTSGATSSPMPKGLLRRASPL